MPQNKVDVAKVTGVDSYRGLRVLEAGLEPGQRVIVEGVQLVRQGQKVDADRHAARKIHDRRGACSAGRPDDSTAASRESPAETPRPARTPKEGRKDRDRKSRARAAAAEAPDSESQAAITRHVAGRQAAEVRPDMVNFFIGRPIFATVLALLMLLVGGICIFVLPIAQYPEITPPQVQVTTTFTGADAQTVAETVTTPIEQQVNGVKGMIYFNSDSTSNGVSTIVATFDVGYSQDIGAVDIQNRVQTAQAVLPPEVKQFGVTIKKTSTDMVCVVNLVSPDGRVRLDVPRQLCPDLRARRPQAHSGRQRRERIRPQVRHAHLARARPPGRPADRAVRGDRRHPVRKQAGRRRPDRQPARASGPGAQGIPDPGQGTADDRGRVRGDHRQAPQ